ncbi:MAG: histidine phosphatase family protein [Bdellovibrionia bacterium]
MVKKLIFIRHAEVARVHQGRYLGRKDVALCPVGVQQAHQLSRVLQRVSLQAPQLWVSPLRRCQQTAQILGFPQSTPRIFDDLREIDFGEFEGKRFSEIQASYPEAVEQWAQFQPQFQFPQGESLRQFLERMERVQAQILAEFKKKNSPSELLLVTHGGVISTLLCLFLGLHPSQYLIFKIHKPSYSELSVYENGRGVLEKLNWGLPDFRSQKWRV